MGKGTDLWDDSSLIDAFDNAMATYKAMHSKSYHASSPEVEKHTSNGNDLVLTEKTAGLIEPEDNGNNISTDATENCVPCYNIEAATEDLSIQENNMGANLNAQESDLHSSGFPCTNGKTDVYPDQQSMEYDQLLKQYYELEEQKQKVVQQLHQANYWNYQTPVQSSTCQTHQVSAYNAPEHGLHAPCSLCSCHCLAVPLIPTSACAIGGLSAGGYGCCPSWIACCSGSQAHQVPDVQCPADSGVCSTATSCVLDPMKHSNADENAVKAGILAAEKAINSLKMEISTASNVCEEKGNGKEKSSGIFEGNGSQSISSETDLTVVLNAWYLAGFHTGRYLLEQPKRNAHQ